MFKKYPVFLKEAAIGSYSALLIAFTLMVGVAAAQPNTYILDLANPHSKRNISAGTAFSLQVVNKIPEERYFISTERRIIDIVALPLPVGIERSPDSELHTEECPDMARRVVNDLSEVETEKAIPETIRQLVSDAGECGGPVSEALLQASRHRVEDSFSLAPGEELVVVVERGEEEWKFRFSTGARGEWRVSYGFTFLPRAQDDNFFVQQSQDDASAFIIEEGERRGDFNFAPSLLFTYIPSGDAFQNRSFLQNWRLGPTFGVGANLQAPSIFAGLGLTYGENVIITGGGTIHQQRRLLSQYDEGDRVNTNLTREQLHEEVYGLNFFVGLSFRFGSNPFSRDGQEDSTPTAPTETNGSESDIDPDETVDETGSSEGEDGSEEEDDSGEQRSYITGDLQLGDQIGSWSVVEVEVDPEVGATGETVSWFGTASFEGTATLQGTLQIAEGNYCLKIDEPTAHALLPHFEADTGPSTVCFRNAEEAAEEFEDVSNGDTVRVLLEAYQAVRQPFDDVDSAVLVQRIGLDGEEG